jgi:hypothetical protein
VIALQAIGHRFESGWAYIIIENSQKSKHLIKINSRGMNFTSKNNNNNLELKNLYSSHIHVSVVQWTRTIAF